MIILSFIPWVLFGIITSISMKYMTYAALAGAISYPLIRLSALKKKYILEWVGCVFFIFVIIISYTKYGLFFESQAAVIANAVLACTMIVSIIIGMPFTLQYSLEQVTPFEAASVEFNNINIIISTVWACCMVLVTIDSYLQQRHMIYLPLSYLLISLCFFIAIWVTKICPALYLKYNYAIKMKRREVVANNPYLQNNYAPVVKEIITDTLNVIGEVPKDLCGTYMRNGPNPQFHPVSYTYPIDGDGMVHAVTLTAGKASYKNKYVETAAFLAEKQAGKVLYSGISHIVPLDPAIVKPGMDPGPAKNGAIIHIIKHAGKHLALSEAGQIGYEMDNQLNTLGPWAPRGEKQQFSINAHTHYDSINQCLCAFTYDIEKQPFLSYIEIDDSGLVTKNIPIDKKYPTMIHDFIVTDNYAIFFDCPAVFDLKSMKKGGALLEWRPGYPTRIILLHRKTHQIQTIDTNAFFVFHFANAFEKEGFLYIDYIKHDSYDFSHNFKENKDPHTLYRTTIDMTKKHVSHTQLDDLSAEFLRINEAYTAQSYRYVYYPVDHHNTGYFNGLSKFDLVTHKADRYDFGKHMECGEPVFAPKSGGCTEDDGYIILFTYNQHDSASECVIFDAVSLRDGPVARIVMPQRVPHGLHGSWMES